MIASSGTNLRLYHYAGNNPITYTDPDGLETWEPLTHKILWKRAFSTGAVVAGEITNNNRVVGVCFEKAVGQIFNLPKNHTGFSSSVRTNCVEPDFVGSNSLTTISTDSIQNISYFPTGVFIEAKTSKVIDLDGSTPLQMKAMIDACSNQKSNDGKISGEYGTACLFLITLYDSEISPDLKQYATTKGVNVYHFKALYDKDSPNRIKLTPGILINIPINSKDIIPIPIKIKVGTGNLDF